MARKRKAKKKKQPDASTITAAPVPPARPGKPRPPIKEVRLPLPGVGAGVPRTYKPRPSPGVPGGIRGGRKTQPRRTTAAEPPKGLSQVKRTRPKPAKASVAAKPEKKVRRKRRTIRQRGRTRVRRT